MLYHPLACGIIVKWNDNGTAYFSLDGKDFVFDVVGASIHEVDGSFNYIETPPGGDNCFVYCSDSEIYVDYDTLESLLFLLGIKAVIHMDNNS